MGIGGFLDRHGLLPEQLEGAGCLEALLREMEQGLAGMGKIPMIPSYLALDTRPEPGQACCVLDAGGTNLRYARAEFEGDGSCSFQGLAGTFMPGTRGELTFDRYNAILAECVHRTGCPERVGFCFSYNVTQNRDLDGTLDFWCKEVRVPDAPGKLVGASLRKAIGEDCRGITVLNDSVAALLGAHCREPEVTLGLILGTGVNVCYSESCRNIPKIPTDIRGESMIISTEIGEFDGFPKSTFDKAVIAGSDAPEMAHAEKQCAGGYLGSLISLAWKEAAREVLIPEVFAGDAQLPQISDWLAGKEGLFPEDAGARKIAETMIHRAAKIAAVLSAGAVVRSCKPGQTCKMVIEGSQFRKLTGFAEHFLTELDFLLKPYEIRITVTQVENSCLTGAAVAAFAEPM